MSVRLVVLASGSGTNLQAIIDSCAIGTLPGAVVGVVTNRAGAFASIRADQVGIPHTLVMAGHAEQRSDYDIRLADAVAAYEPDWIVLAGWMRILTMSFLGRFPTRVVNLHPALPGDFPGTHAIERAYADAVAGRRTHTGVMVHLVADEGVDTGPVLSTTTVPIHASDSLDDLVGRVHDAEHRLLVETLATLCAETLRRCDPRTATLQEADPL